IQFNKPVGEAGVRSEGRRLPRYVRGIYMRRSLRRRMIKNRTMATAEIKAGTRVQTRPAAEVDSSCWIGVSLDDLLSLVAGFSGVQGAMRCDRRAASCGKHLREPSTDEGPYGPDQRSP